MRASEFLHETNWIAHGLYDPAKDVLGRRDLDDTRKPEITLKMLNTLKKIRKVRRRALMKRLKVAKVMYGDPNHAQELFDLKRQREEQDHDLKMAKAELKNDIDAAEIEQDRKDDEQGDAANRIRGDDAFVRNVRTADRDDANV